MQPHSRLLTLPVELRLCIYEFVFIPIQFDGPRNPDGLNEKASRSLLPLLTCYQINEEARLIAFSRTTFHVTNIATLLWNRARNLSWQLLEAVRYLAITFNLSPGLRIYDILDETLLNINLEQLTFIAQITSGPPPIKVWIVFRKDSEGAVRHMYTELPNFDLNTGRRMGLLRPLWNLLDTIPEGRKRNIFNVGYFLKRDR